eukprot:1868152-Rhodomonas_salina.2
MKTTAHLFNVDSNVVIVAVVKGQTVPLRGRDPSRTSGLCPERYCSRLCSYALATNSPVPVYLFVERLRFCGARLAGTDGRFCGTRGAHQLDDRGRAQWAQDFSHLLVRYRP